MKYKIFNIQYDVDYKKDLNGLPKELEIDVETNDYIDEEYIEDIISDYISDVTGFCHRGFEYIGVA